MGIIQVDDFATESQISELLNIYHDNVAETEAKRCLECNKAYYNFIFNDGNVFRQLTTNVKEYSQDCLKLAHSGISVLVNTHLAYHADNCQPSHGLSLGCPNDGDKYGLINVSEDMQWVPNHCHTRVLTAVVYLDNLSSGATVFPTQSTKILPKTGRAIIFPCDNNYIHGVENVGKNIRIVAVLWFVKDE